jgi:hypothetical protein
MYRVALVLSGQQRFADKTFHQFKKYLPFDIIDVFFHTWDLSDEEVNSNSFFISNKQLIDTFKPVKFLFEEHPQLEFEKIATSIGKNSSAPPINILSMFYSMLKSDLLRQQHEKVNEFKYDLVIRARFDFFLLAKHKFERAPSKEVYFPDLIRNDSVFCDWFFYSSSENMTLITKCFENIISYSKNNVSFCGENLLYRHLQNHGLIGLKFVSSGFLIRDKFKVNLNFGRVHFKDHPFYFFSYILSRFITWMKLKSISRKILKFIE